jgi:hypothetical protein
MNRKVVFSLTNFVFGLSTQLCPAGETDSRLLRIVNGDDWSLPPDVRLTPNTGFGWIEPEWVRRWTDLYPVDDTDELQFCEYVYFNWADAFPGAEDRVVLSNCGPYGFGFGNSPDYRVPSGRVLQHAIERGFGGRDGQVEVWNRYMFAGYGITVDQDGYMILDEDYPPIKENRVWHTENENYLTGGDNLNATFGPDCLADYRWFASNLRLLQMRRNWDLLLWTKEGIDGGWAALKWPEITRYVQLSLGKTPSTSPDVWCWLREGYTPGKNVDPPRPEIVAVRNFECWLIQRDVASGGRTQPAAKVDITYMGQWASRPKHEFQARQTDLANGQDSIFFHAARSWFGPMAQPVRLFVTYRDDPDAAWHIEYEASVGLATTPNVQTTGSGQWKTVSMAIPALRCSGHLADNMDFRLVATGKVDVVVRVVRLIKWP